MKSSKEETPKADAVAPQWHVSIRGRKRGPYSTNQVIDLVARGKIRRGTRVWKEGMWNWARCSSLKEFEHLFSIEGIGVLTSEDSETGGNLGFQISDNWKVALVILLTVGPILVSCSIRYWHNASESESLAEVATNTRHTPTVSRAAVLVEKSAREQRKTTDSSGTRNSAAGTSTPESEDLDTLSQSFAPVHSISKNSGGQNSLVESRQSIPASPLPKQAVPHSALDPRVATPTDPPKERDETLDAKESANSNTDSPPHEVERILKEARASRQRILGIQLSGTRPNLDQYLLTGDQSLDLSEQYAKQGKSEIALAAATQAKNFFETIEDRFMKTPGAVYKAAAAVKPTSEENHISKERLNIAVEPLSQKTFRPGDTVKAMVQFKNISPATQFLRRDTVVRFDPGEYSTHIKPTTFKIAFNSGNGSHQSKFLITRTIPNGSYALRTEILSSSSNKPVLTHDFVFRVTDSSTSLLAADEEGNNPLGKVGDTLKKLGVNLRIDGLK